MSDSIKHQQLLEHASRESCWLAIHGSVWDVTAFIDRHPGGAALILGQAGKDATQEYDDFHDRELVEKTLGPEAKKGILAEDVNERSSLKSTSKNAFDSPSRPAPSLRSMVNLHDFERMAATHMSPAAWAYVISGADDEITRDENARTYSKVFLRGRVLRDVHSIDCTITILGQKSSVPFYTSPVGFGKVAHQDGECAIAAGNGKEGVIQVVNTVSSMPIEQIMNARVSKDQPIFWQLYLDKDLEKSVAFVRRVEAAGVKAIWLTVDSPVVGKRERDERGAAHVAASETMEEVVESVKQTGLAAANTGFINASVDWKILDWLRGVTDLPIVIKGIQCVEDAITAFNHNVEGIVLSNHGGRSQDTAQPPLLTLLEINRYAPQILGKHMEVYVDGGIRRGTDVVKALALGATAVGIGRPTLYSMAGGFGAYGVRRMIQILRREIELNMAFVGAKSVNELHPGLLNARQLDNMLSQSCRL